MNGVLALTAHSKSAAANPQSRPAQFSLGWSALLVALDLLMFAFSAYAAISLVRHAWHPVVLSPTSLVFIGIWLVIFLLVGLYKQSFALSVKDEFYYTVAALVVGTVPLLVLFTLVPAISTSRLILVLSLLCSIITVGGTRALLHSVRNAQRGRRPRSIAVIGSPHRLDTVISSLNLPENSRLFRLDLDRVDDDRIATDSIRWLQECQRRGCEKMVLTEIPPPTVLPELLATAARFKVSLAFAMPRVVAHAYSLSLETDGQQALLIPSSLQACTPRARLQKRLFDVAVASLAFLVFCPVMLVVALVLALDRSGPILFRQARVGRDGKTFEILKFRTMRKDAELETGPVWVRAGDDRVTRIGRFLRRTSLDELPQIFNVLRGEMSVVGPRPERPVFVEEFQKHLPRYNERHLVRPGITGWSQINMRRNLDQSDIGEKLSYDLFYIEHYRLFMDISVVCKTALEVLFHRAR